MVYLMVSEECIWGQRQNSLHKLLHLNALHRLLRLGGIFSRHQQVVWQNLAFLLLLVMSDIDLVVMLDGFRFFDLIIYYHIMVVVHHLFSFFLGCQILEHKGIFIWVVVNFFSHFRNCEQVATIASLQYFSFVLGVSDLKLR